jgi:hypothetical protein
VEQLRKDLLKSPEGNGLVLEAGNLGLEGLLLLLLPLLIDAIDAEVSLDILSGLGRVYIGWCVSLGMRSGF